VGQERKGKNGKKDEYTGDKVNETERGTEREKKVNRRR